MIEKPWAENIVFIEEEYEETHPGKLQYSSYHFGVLRESRFVYIPEDCEDPGKYILEVRKKMHDRLMASAADMVAKKLSEKKLKLETGQ